MKTKEFFCQAAVRQKDEVIIILVRFEVLLAVSIKALSFWV